MRDPTAFDDRAAAGRALGQRLAALNLPTPRVVVALPRGGVPVGVEVARALSAPLGLLMVRKIGAPSQPEWAVAALAEGQMQPVVSAQAPPPEPGFLAQETARARQELARRRRRYGPSVGEPALADRTVIVVDDGVATGTTMRAALEALRARHPARLVLAVPVAASASLESLRPLCDDSVCLRPEPQLQAVGHHYRDFRQLDDDEVLRLLAERSPPTPAPGG